MANLRMLLVHSFGLSVGLVSVCLAFGQVTATDADVAPLGPVIDASFIEAAGLHANVDAVGNAFHVTFAAFSGRPKALFVFPTKNFSHRLGLAVDITNEGRQALRVYGQINMSEWTQGYALVPAEATRTLYIYMFRSQITPPDVWTAFKVCAGMQGIPGGEMRLFTGGEVDASMVTNLGIFVLAPRHPVSLVIRNIQPFGAARPPDRKSLGADFFPLIDRYGQQMHKEWPDKIHSDAEMAAAVAKEAGNMKQNPRPKDWDQYGGWADGPKLRATGHFRTEKYQGKWWLVDPEGHLFWSNGVVEDEQSEIEPTQTRCPARYYALPAPGEPAPGGDFIARNLQIKYGADWRAAWDKVMTQRLASWGYNTVTPFRGGASVNVHKVPFTSTRGGALPNTRKVPYTWLFRSQPSKNFGPVGPVGLDPNVEERMADLRQEMTEVAAQLNNDPWCIGYFVDNEIHVEDPEWWEGYYAAVSRLGKELLPNKLYLGSRLDFHEWPNSTPERYAIVRIAAKYTDVVSFTQYRWSFDSRSIQNARCRRSAPALRTPESLSNPCPARSGSANRLLLLCPPVPDSVAVQSLAAEALPNPRRCAMRRWKAGA